MDDRVPDRGRGTFGIGSAPNLGSQRAPMITFLTWFLGLTAGLQTVEVALSADRPIARVELLLDGEAVGELTAPPWRFQCDFGELSPRRLEAIAFGRDGREIDRAEQLVNSEVREATLALKLERDEAGTPVAVAPVWRSVEHPAPDSLTVTFDGQPLAFDTAERIELPAVDLSTLHFVAAEAIDPAHQVATADLAFGGVLGSEVSTRNTAVAVQLTSRRRLRKPAHAQGLIELPEGPATVLAVERGTADTVAVVEPSALAELRQLRHRRRAYGPHSEDDRMFFVHPVPEPTEVGYEVFRRWGPVSGRGGYIAHRLPNLRQSLGLSGQTELPEAVGVAAMQGASSAQPRIVLLIVGPGATSGGRFSPLEIRRYLSRLQVPLAVWYVEIEFSQQTASAKRAEMLRREALLAAGEAPSDWNEPRRRRLAALRRDWGEVTEIGSATQLAHAVRTLRAQLTNQRIVWIDGDHLPQDLRLAASAEGVRWAGSEAAP